ncbi:MAG: 2-succinyl-5-enolpyruvyl-6-hydroxy-3-cyclohexene-1-carboxylic-acid synthase [Cytophagaceae bacterium]|nr:2-succinyl-5-enolpyruvyl-6-hydroxy-3-cyclohexene-1-carboxylic-acid synthase [Cytophagaceae bacterium]MDW8456786.1 2-succinyl-5-enolpyruvyl-6-hydroxy-3-cyclohexene-1-carboxylic-acid synthase [Cytophagaceae bacterium]
MQSVYNIAQICALKGLRNAVLSPGSRCAPLTVSFVRHPQISTYTISDERSAGFIALGMSDITKLPTVLICTSGSAGLNYSPAIAEAYYRQVPLLILTADRPAEWIDQADGQTIRQAGMYGAHVKKSYSLPLSDDEHVDNRWYYERVINEAINLALSFPPGPVHINIPFREPFYPKHEFGYSEDCKIIDLIHNTYEPNQHMLQSLSDELSQYPKILIVCGQHSYNPSLNDALNIFSHSWRAPLLADIIANMNACSHLITMHDWILNDGNDLNKFTPDILITCGQSVISKNLKKFLRTCKPHQHWHVGKSTEAPDTFQSLSKIISADPVSFFSLLKPTHKAAESHPYYEEWQQLNFLYKTSIERYFEQESPFSEAEVVYRLLQNLPEHSLVYLSNSMPVRYANAINVFTKKNVEYFCNRGTSGIDGVLSTAYGAALKTDKMVTVIIGDLAAIYDRNAFWNQYQPPNLRIVVINNGGGIIFSLIDGPSTLPELEEYFVTRQTISLKNTIKDTGMEYMSIKDKPALMRALNSFYENSYVSKVMEVHFETTQSKKHWQSFKQSVKR